MELALSRTRAVNGKVPGVVGVPVMTPLLLIESPAGRKKSAFQLASAWRALADSPQLEAAARQQALQASSDAARTAAAKLRS